MSIYSSDSTFKHNLDLVSKGLEDKNIIYSNQYIADDETQYDRDGPESTWSIHIICIEKTEDDYIYHLFQSDWLHSYSTPSFREVNKFHSFTRKLSDLKNDLSDIFNKPTNVMWKFIEMFNDTYSYGLQSNDEILINELKKISFKINELEIIYEEKCDKEKIERDIKYNKYLQSDEYKQYLKEEKEREIKKKEEEDKKEAERLKRCIEAYGEVEGTKFWQRL
jgi:hypothetical protein